MLTRYWKGIIFIAAGFETTANTLSTLCYNLARNPDVLQTLLDEVDDITEKFDGVVNHETISDMVYLEACINQPTFVRFLYHLVHHDP